MIPNNYYYPTAVPPYQNTVQQPIENTQNNCNSVTLIRVPSIDVVKSFHVPAGSSVSFMHETEPYMYIKTAPSSPFEAPSLSIFKIVKVDAMDKEETPPEPEYVTRQEYNNLKASIKKLEERINSNEPVYRKPNKKYSERPANTKREQPNK